MAKKDWEIGASYVEMDGTVVMLWYKKKNKKSGIMVESDRSCQIYQVTTGKIAKNLLGDYKTWGKSKNFLSRNEAIKYAERYMEKH